MFFVGHFRVIAVNIWAICLSQRLARTIYSYGTAFVALAVCQVALLRAYTCKALAKLVLSAFESCFV
jgi:hypothetical protein